MTEASELFHPWNGVPIHNAAGVALDDESLRDGLQSPSVRQPTIGERIEFLHRVDALGIGAADIGMPATGTNAEQMVGALVDEILDAGLGIRPNCAARTVVSDIEPIARIAQRTGMAIEVMAFIGCSPIRMAVEGWTLAEMAATVEKAVAFAVSEGLPVCMVTEDTTRATPDALSVLYGAGIDAGATGLCLCDTVGAATPLGVTSLVQFALRTFGRGRPDLRVDWHGHNDRGLGTANSLAAIGAGAHRIHGTALGIGERCGNTAMDQLVVNLYLEDDERSVEALRAYCDTAARIFGVDVPPNYPAVGGDAFRTATGVHAAAIEKAAAEHDTWTADRVYSAVPAGAFGMTQVIEIGPASGMANLRHWLRRNGVLLDADQADRVLATAKTRNHVLDDTEMVLLVADELSRTPAAVSSKVL